MQMPEISSYLVSSILKYGHKMCLFSYAFSEDLKYQVLNTLVEDVKKDEKRFLSCILKISVKSNALELAL